MGNTLKELATPSVSCGRVISDVFRPKIRLIFSKIFGIIKKIKKEKRLSKMNLLQLFIILNIVNVIIQTAKSICTVKAGKWVASVVNAIAYGFYTVVIIYMNCDLTLWAKVAVVAATNLVGVFIVKLIEEKMRKDKLWKIDVSVKGNHAIPIKSYLESLEIPFCYNIYGKHTMFTIFCENQKQSQEVAKIVKEYQGKYFVSENRSYL